METKPLLYGLIGFFVGGLLVSIAATTFDAPQSHGDDMAAMTDSLKAKTGDAYDAAFLEYMIEHHRSAVDMAELTAERSNRQELKGLSRDIISAQQDEIARMQRWQQEWGYDTHKGQSH